MQSSCDNQHLRGVSSGSMGDTKEEKVPLRRSSRLRAKVEKQDTKKKPIEKKPIEKKPIEKKPIEKKPIETTQTIETQTKYIIHSSSQQRTKYINWKYEKHHPLLTLLEIFPDENWSCQDLEDNPILPINYNLKHNYSCDCSFCYFRKQYKEKINKEKITLSDVLNDPHKREWNWFWESRKPKIDLEFVLNNRRLNWNWEYISRTATLSDIQKYRFLPWEWRNVSRNSNIKLKDINSPLFICWHWDHVSLNPNITSKDIKRKNITWVARSVYQNANISPEDVLQLEKFLNDTHFSNTYLPWIFTNPNITLKYILKNEKLLREKVSFSDYITMPTVYEAMSKNQFLADETACRKSLKKDIKDRREKVKSLNLFGNLNNLVNKYVGYM